MENCPVCHTPLAAAVCEACGFDPSCHYESFPTLAPIVPGLAAVSARKIAWESAQSNLLQCPNCGGRSFFFLTDTQTLLCPQCGWQKPITAPVPAPAPAPAVPNPRAPYAGCVALGDWHTVVLRRNGTVFCSHKDHRGETDRWTGITAVAAGYHTTYGIRQDGTVTAVGNNTCGQCNTGSWTDIVSISASYHHAAGLRRDGTVVAAGENKAGQCNTGCWSNITAIATGQEKTVGLRGDGTVISTHPYDSSIHHIDQWTDITAIAVSGNIVFGLRRNGTVVSTDGECSRWNNITHIATGNYHTVGLRRDGTVVAAGSNHYHQCDVESWQDIAAIFAGGFCTVGIREDGSLVSTDSSIQNELKGLTLRADTEKSIQHSQREPNSSIQINDTNSRTSATSQNPDDRTIMDCLLDSFEIMDDIINSSSFLD